MSSYGGPKIVDTGLVLYLDSGNSKSYPGSGLSWYDLTDNQLIGTFSQRNSTQMITYDSDKGGLIFPGDDIDGVGGVSVRFYNNQIFKQTSKFTIELWLRCDVISSDEFIVLNGSGTIDGTQHNYVIRKSGSLYRFYISDGTNTTNISSTIVPRTTIHQLVISVDYSSNINFYLDGVLMETVASPYASYLGNNQSLEIGGLAGGGGDIRFFKGVMYKMSLYNIDLSPSQVLENYNSTKNRFGPVKLNMISDGLILALDAGNTRSYPGTSSSIWYDLSGNGYNADVYNSPDFSNQEGGKIQLDGLDDYIEISFSSNRNSTIKNSTFTIIFGDSRLTTNPGVSTYLYSMSSVFSCLWKRDSLTKHYIRVNNVTVIDLDLGTISENVVHLTLVIDENYLTKFYVNGTLRNTYDYSGYITDYTWVSDFEFGRRRNFVEGPYDEFDYHGVYLYNRALTEDEVLHNYYVLKNRLGI